MKKKKGVTLIELIIVMGISAMILGCIYVFYFTNSRSINETQYKSDLQGEGELMVKKLSKTLIQAKNIVEIEDAGNNDILEETDGEISDAKIKIQTDTSSFSDIIYTVADSKLKENVNGNNVVIGNYVKSIEFETLDGKQFKDSKGIKVTLNLSRKLANEEITYQMKTDIVFRNANSVP